MGHKLLFAQPKQTRHTQPGMLQTVFTEQALMSRPVIMPLSGVLKRINYQYFIHHFTALLRGVT